MAVTTRDELRALVSTRARTPEKVYARADIAPWPLRLMLGFGFMYHGYPKLFTAEGHEGFVGMLASIGVPLPEIMAWVVGFVEFFGGAALILGLLVPFVCLLGIIDMIVAMFLVHLPQGFNFLNITGMGEQGLQFGMPGYEVNLLYIAGFLALMVTGAGAVSVDRVYDRRRNPEPAPPPAT